eukprot:m.86751 g.86751  ORF g.86751 m.86751 type:complete len:243 (+) comp19864_c0_seq1:156-884(+)
MAQRGNNGGDGRWLLIIGATGQTGGRVLRGALDRGWRVTALVRTPTKLPDDVRGDPRVTVCTGSLTDAGAVEAALRCCSAVFVAAVDYMRAKEHPLTNFVAALPGAMRRNGAGRLVFQSGALAAIPGEELRGRRWFLRNSFAKWFGYEEQIVDLEGVHATLSGLEPGACDDGGAPGGVGAANGTPVRWTVTRPWIIKSRPSWGKLVSGELSMLTTFDDVAAWSLDVLDDESTVGRYVFPGYA